MSSTELYPGRTHKKNPKFLNETLSLLESFYKSVLGNASSDDGLIQNSPSILKFKKHWNLVISGNFVWTKLSRKYSINLQTSNFGLIECDASLKVSKFEHTIAYVSSFRNEHHNRDEIMYYRTVMPVGKEFDVSSYVQNVLYDTDGVIHYNSTKCTIQSQEFDLYFYTEDKSKRSYLIIDSKFRTTFNSFQKYNNTILICLGFCTGAFFSDDAYYFSFPEDTLNIPTGFYYERGRKSCFNGFPLLRMDLLSDDS